ncbi:FAD binding domain-containing protein [Chloroflexota bacterium]
MKLFKHVEARTVDEAVKLLSKNRKTKLIAGGTDLLGILKDRNLPEYPEIIVNIKNIPGLKSIEETGGVLKIGALTKLEDIAESTLVQKKYRILAEAAKSVATPHIRRMGTLGGNLCQDVRCWYYRYPHELGGEFECYLKNGQSCYALTRENQYHSIFGGLRVNNTSCQSVCPASTAISSYISQFRKGNILEAARILLEYNPIPSITGRVCPHFCEQACNRSSFDESVSVREIERFIGDYILDNAAELIKVPENETGKSVAIVGSGPAGLAAAYYLRMAGHRINVFDRQVEAGGLLTYVIPAYRLPKDIVKRTIKAFEKAGIEFKLDVDLGKDVTLEQLKQDFNGVFVATGAWNPVSIGLDGEESTRFGLEFLADIHRGIKKAPGKKVLVIGGGNAAIDIAISSLRLGAEEATMACLESPEEMPALPWEVEQAVEEKVNVLPCWSPHKVLRANGKVTGMELIRCTSVFDDEGGFAPCYDETVKKVIEADVIFMAVGYASDLRFAKGVLKTRHGHIVTDSETEATSEPGIFAGGVVVHGPATVIDAVASGKRAAVAMGAYLSSTAEKAGGEVTNTLLRFNADYLKPTSKLKASRIPVKERNIDIEDTPSPRSNEIEAEANRCFNCGCLSVNASDMAVVLAALNAKVNITSANGTRAIPIDEFLVSYRDIMEAGEIVTEIEIPELPSNASQRYIKFRLRDSVDFALVSVASVITEQDGICRQARIILGAVAPRPVRATAAEKVLVGRKIDATQAAIAAQAALKDALPLSKNSYKINIAKDLVRQAVLTAGDTGEMR